MIEYPKYTKLPEEYIRRKINEFLAEDCPNGDITAEPIFTHNSSATAEILAEQELVFAGRDIVKIMFENSFETEILAEDGETVQNGRPIARITGNTAQLLLRERTLLNILQRLCGIATLTSRYVAIASPYHVKILDTRKTTPGLRLFEKYAVAAGGGSNHRLDLSSGILIKDNHLAAAGGVFQAVSKIRNAASGFPIELEAENFEQIEEGLNANVDGFLLDNMLPGQISKAVTIIRNHENGKYIFIEASGGITLDNLGEYVATGVDAISIGALTHSAKAVKIHMEFV